MQRRTFLAGMGALFALSAGTATAKLWPESGVLNPCTPEPIPPEILGHSLVRQAFEGISFNLTWDMHTHLTGMGDSGSGIWVNPRMHSPLHPIEYVQKLFYLNAACAKDHGGTVDDAFVTRLLELLDAFPPGFKVVLFAFDRYYDREGRPVPALTQFCVPNRHTAEVEIRQPDRLEWAASVHPYRPDWKDELDFAVAHGARAVKWLPPSMGIDPDDKRCEPFYRRLADAGLPLISHAGEEMAAPGAGEQDNGNPLRLRRALDAGVRVVVAHCASLGKGVDLDKGKHGPKSENFNLFARLMDIPRYENSLYGDISAITQINRMGYIKPILERPQWHSRLLNGSDYPLPGVMPLFSSKWLANKKLIPNELVSPLKVIRNHNPLMFDFVLKRQLSWQGKKFPARVFETRPFFDKEKPA